MSGRKKSQAQVTNAMKEELLKWICIQHATNSQLDRNLLKQKAIELVRQFELTGLKCSESWLTVFLKRYGFSVTLNDCCGPVFDDYTIWVDMIRALINQYRYEDQYHVDELSMYTDFLPPQKLQPDEQQPDHPVDMSALKLQLTTPAMYQMTILLACSAAGAEKQKPLVCGPCEVQENEKFSYCQSENSRISDELFSAWLFLLNHEMSRNNRSILLFMSRGRINALKLVHLTHILPVFFPHDFPPHLRPIRGDIFHYVKMFYRELYVEKLCKSDENTQWQPQEIAENLTEAWRQIPKELIISRFQRTKFREDASLLSMECKFWENLQTGVPFRHFVTFDDDLSDAHGPLRGDLTFLTKVKQRYNSTTPVINLKTEPAQIDDTEGQLGTSGRADSAASLSDDSADGSSDCSDRQEESADFVTNPTPERHGARDDDEKEVSSSLAEPDKVPEAPDAVEMSDEFAKSNAGAAHSTEEPPGGDSKVFESFKSLMDPSLSPKSLKARSESISIPGGSAFPTEDVHKSLEGAQATRTSSKQPEDNVGVEDSDGPQGVTVPAIDLPTNTAISANPVNCKTAHITPLVKTCAAVEPVNNSSEINSYGIKSKSVSPPEATPLAEKVATKLSESITVSFNTSGSSVEVFSPTAPVTAEEEGSSSLLSIPTADKNVDERSVHASLSTEITGDPLGTWVTSGEIDNAQSDGSLASEDTTGEQMQSSPSAVTYIKSNRVNGGLIFPVMPESAGATSAEIALCSGMLNNIRNSLTATSSGNLDADQVENSVDNTSKTSEIQNFIFELEKQQGNNSNVPKIPRYFEKKYASLANSARAPEFVVKAEISATETSASFDIDKMRRSAGTTLEELQVFRERSLSGEPGTPEALEAKAASLLYQQLIGAVTSYPVSDTPLQEASRELEARLKNLQADDSTRKLRDLLGEEGTLESYRHSIEAASILRELLEEAKELAENPDEDVSYGDCSSAKRKRENDDETGEPDAKKQSLPENWAKCFENYPVFGPYDIDEPMQKDNEIDGNNFTTEFQAKATEVQSPNKKERFISTRSEDSPRPSCSYEKY